MNSPRVSVITRTRDRAPLLLRAAASVAQQTFTDIEWILVNDGGDTDLLDATVAQIDESLRQRLVRIDNQSSSGIEAAASQGFASATGEFVAVLDDDDSWEPGFLDTCVAALDADQLCVAVATPVDIVYERALNGSLIEDRHVPFAYTREDVPLVELVVENTVPPVSLVSRSSVSREIGFWDPSLPVLADWDYLLRLACVGPIRYLADKDILAHWHHRPASTDSFGNSIFVLGSLHDHYHNVIRDRYLRADLGQGQGLGFALTLGHYVRTERAAVTHLESSLHEAQHLQFAQLTHQLIKLEGVISEQQRSIDALVEIQQRNTQDIEKLAGLVDKLRRLTPSAIKRRFQF